MISAKYMLRRIVSFNFVLLYRILLQCGADVDKQDIDGWTPLHAAAYWGQKETSQLLADNLADMDAKNYVVSLVVYLYLRI